MRVYDSTLLKVNANTENERVVLEAEGTLGALARPVIRRINKMFEDEKPVLSEDDKIIFSTWVPPIPSDAFNRVIAAQMAPLRNRKVPDQLSIGITMNCPNKCIHCGAADIVADPELSLNEINDTVNEAIEMGSYLISFDGGETMLRRDLVDMVANVNSSKAIATCFTSGYGLTEQRAKELKEAGLYAMRVSMDSPFEEEHDRVRGRKGSYKEAIEGIKNSKNAGIFTDMFIVVSPENIDNLPDFYELASELGMDEMSLYEIVAVGRWLEHEDEVISEQDVDRLASFQKKMNARKEGPRVTAFPYFMGPDQFGCFAGRRWIHVTSAGDVLPCAYTPLSFGNIREEGLKAAWKKMTSHSAYKCSAESCMMRDTSFRQEYIHTIPSSSTLPYRMDR